MEISQSVYEDICKAAKYLPPGLEAKESTSKKGNTVISVNCERGTLATISNCKPEMIVSIIQAANLLRELSYDLQIKKLQYEREGFN